MAERRRQRRTFAPVGTPDPFVTVIMPVRNEEEFIARSVRSVLAQDFPRDRMEVVVADGMSDDGTAAVVADLARSDARLRWLENPGRIVATGLNSAIAASRADIFLRVDGHCEIAPDYVRRCAEHLLRGEAEGVGGPLETVGQDPLSKAIALAMSSSFGVGGVAFRTTTGKTAFVDTVAFPAYTRAAVEAAGPFDEELVRNQDDEYNYRLRELGARILLASDVRSRYYSRGSFRSLWRQYYQYGFWKVRVMQKHPAQMRPRQFVPMVFVGTLLAGAFAAPFSAGARLGLAGVGAAYVLANVAASVRAASRESSGRRPLLSISFAFATMHVAYGLGFWKGLARFAHRWGDRASRPWPVSDPAATAEPV